MTNIAGRIGRIFQRGARGAAESGAPRGSLGAATGVRNSQNLPATTATSSQHVPQGFTPNRTLVGNLAGYQARAGQTSAPSLRTFSTSTHFYAGDQSESSNNSTNDVGRVSQDTPPRTSDLKIAARSFIAKIKDESSAIELLDLINRSPEGQRVEFRLSVMEEAKEQSKENFAKYKDAFRAASSEDGNNLEALREAEKIQELGSILKNFHDAVRDDTKDILRALLTNNLPGAQDSPVVFARGIVYLIYDSASMGKQLNNLKLYAQCTDKSEIDALHRALKLEAKYVISQKMMKFDPFKKGMRREQLDWKKERVLTIMLQIKKISRETAVLNRFIKRLGDTSA